ncbi:glutamine--fructose-6-phosphate transaminase (isomerizing) [Candidatus Woesearchaeota archaeon]|nr:glutamine--fructose-6-phosphate transaminase (isomerizing) [Candidatus Woesearchaeota archaeon]
MCGIIGYVGYREAEKILLKGLHELEYRGYDSAGIAIVNSGLQVNKVVGRVANLENKGLVGTFGIGHTRWATHGKPTVKNAHPHTDCTGNMALIHNGIIENYLEIKNKLKEHAFKSDTDSEVLLHLIEECYGGDLKKAVLDALKEVKGAYAFCVIHQDHQEIVVARNGSPVVLGLGERENFIASDVSALVPYTKRVVYLNDFELAVVKENGISIFDFKNKQLQPAVKTVDWDAVIAEKKGYKHFMLKEIFEQPMVVRNSLVAPFNLDVKARKIFIVACGTAGYAGLTGKYIIERLAKLPVEFDIASEFRYKDPLIGKDDLLIAISQSGETADTLAALRLAKEKGARTLGIINVRDSTIAREADAVIYTIAGPEIGVASTKAFLAQLVMLYRIAEKLSHTQLDMSAIPQHLQTILTKSDVIREIAKKYCRVYNFLFIGRNLNYPIALEGALKMKEISYIHAEGYASGEMKHGPIALVTDEVPTVAIVPKDGVYEKMISNIEEVKARNGRVIAIATEGDEEIQRHATDIIYIPKGEELFTPLLTVVPLQLLAYHIADLRNCDVDKPRNLAKSVTVE